jgi:lysophospholipase L1-like esterase
MAPMGQHKEMKVEERIKSLHAKLKITPPEENDWKAVAETMRENEAKIGQLIEARRQNPDNMTAVDDIESYRQITQAHADGLQKMASSFSTLYNDMPDAQKRNADQVFGHFEGRGKHGMKHAK